MGPLISHAANPVLKPVFRILLADDSPESQAVIQVYLQGLPYEVEFVGNGKEAVARFRTGQFDLVLLDQHMPVMDGFAAARLIRAWESSHQRTPVPILALTADSTGGAQEQGYAAGCTGWLAKPVSRERLVDALRRFGPNFSTKHARPQNGDVAGAAHLIDDAIARRRPLFLENRRQELRQLQDAIERRDCEFIRITGHRIKGLAGSYGFPDIGLAGSRLEQAAKDRDLAVMRRTIDQLALLLAQAGQAI